MIPPDDSRDLRAEGRRRSWRVGHTAAAQALAKIVSGLSQLVLVPLLLVHLGTDVFGWVMTLFALTGLISFADLGVVIALQQRLAEVWGQARPAELRRVHAGGARLLARLGWAWFAGGAVFAWWLGPALLPAPASVDLPTQRTAWLGVAATIAIGVATAAGPRLALAIQSGWLAAGWAAAAHLALLAAAIIAIYADAGAFVFLALLGVGLVVPGIISGLHVAHRLGWQHSPAPSADPALSTQLWRDGLRFAPPHLAGALVQSATAPLVVHFGGWSAGAALAVLLRLFGPLTQTHALLLGPLWPAYAEASVRQDRAWIARAFRLSLFFTALSALGLLAVTAALPVILRALPGDAAFVPTASLTWLIAGWQIAAMVQTPLGFFLLGHNRLGPIGGRIAAVHLLTLAAALGAGFLWSAPGVIAAMLVGTACGLVPVLLTASLRTLRAP